MNKNKKMQDKEISVSYRQICLFSKKLKKPFNDWTKIHSSQGFAWRPGSVSFATVVDSGRYVVSIDFPRSVELHEATTRAISVPFQVVSKAKYEIASISDGFDLELGPADYQLVFQDWSVGEVLRCKLSFIVDGDSNPRILKSDSTLAPGTELLMKAEPT